MLIDLVRKINKFDPDIREVLFDILNEIESQRLQQEQVVTKVEFNELKEIVKDLAEAQKRTEKKVEELAEAQKRTEKRIEELAEAQRKTEKIVQGLLKDMDEVKRRLDGLSDTVGYGLEDKIIPFMNDFIEKRYGLEVIVVDRRNIVYEKGKFDELNIFIEAKDGIKDYIIIGECKAKPGKRDIKKFLKVKNRVRKYFNKEVKGFIVGYSFHPEVEEYLKDTEEIDYYKTFEIERIANNNLKAEEKV